VLFRSREMTQRLCAWLPLLGLQAHGKPPGARPFAGADVQTFKGHRPSSGSSL
jgi:hypothetical protein